MGLWIQVFHFIISQGWDDGACLSVSQNHRSRTYHGDLLFNYFPVVVVVVVVVAAAAAAAAVVTNAKQCK